MYASSVIYGDYLLVFGGNPFEHTFTSECQTNDLLAFYIPCQVWVPDVNVTRPNTPCRRVAHRAILRNNTFVIVGGYTGVPLGDMYGFNIPSNFCNLHNSISCLNDPVCGWDSNQSLCITLADYIIKPDSKNTTTNATLNNSSAINSTHANSSFLFTSTITYTSTTTVSPTAYSQYINSYPSFIQPSTMCASDDCAARLNVVAIDPGDQCSMCASGSCSFCSPNSCYGISTTQGCVNAITDASLCGWCSARISCADCAIAGCTWNPQLQTCSTGKGYNISLCPATCSGLSSCDSCQRNPNCVWCGSTNSCIDVIAVTTEYSFGQCLRYMSGSACNLPSLCTSHRNCSTCLQQPACGWCSNSMNNSGTCMAGTDVGPGLFRLNTTGCLTPPSLEGNTNNTFVPWNFMSCPDVNECALGIDHCSHNATCINEDPRIIIGSRGYRYEYKYKYIHLLGMFS